MSRTDAARHTDDVRRYYDSNAARFERSGGRPTVHRAIWAPGVTTEDGAFHYVEELILRLLRPSAGVPVVVDLGCGNGASLLYLAERMNLIGEGVTISPAQAARAAELVRTAPCVGRVRCRVGNFLRLPEDLTDVALAFSIEAFVHSPDAQAYFREVARILQPGGRLVVCDDFLAPDITVERAHRDRWLSEFSRGWHVGSLVTVDQARVLADGEGLTLAVDTDLSPYLELRRWRDRCVSMAVAAGRVLPLRGPYWDALFGGNALQRALGEGTLHHRFLVFERRER